MTDLGVLGFTRLLFCLPSLNSHHLVIIILPHCSIPLQPNTY